MTAPQGTGPVIVLLGGDKSSTRTLYHSLQEEFPIAKVILESAVPKSALLRRRIGKLGLFRVVGQVAFSLLIVPWLRRSARDRRQEILASERLVTSDIPSSMVLRVSSVNSEVAIAALRKLAPNIVVVNGTRIISPDVLKCVPATFVNTHAGITPTYRGVHGAYWALVNRDRQGCGVTVHLVDPGIDTGAILRQQSVLTGSDDNFTTYPLLQQAVGIHLLKEVLRDGIEGRWNTQPARSATSRLWTHPTLWQYLWHRLRSGVK